MLVQSCPERKILVTWWQQNHKILSEEISVKKENRVPIIDMPWWYKIRQRSDYSPTHVKQKTSQETGRSLQKFLEPTRKPSVIYTHISLEFGKSCEDLSWNHCTSTPHRSETNEIAERAVRRIKEGTSAAQLQSALDEKWRADSMECYYLSAKRFTDLQCLMGRRPMKGGSECPLTDQWYR